MSIRTVLNTEIKQSFHNEFLRRTEHHINCMDFGINNKFCFVFFFRCYGHRTCRFWWHWTFGSCHRRRNCVHLWQPWTGENRQVWSDRTGKEPWNFIFKCLKYLTWNHVDWNTPYRFLNIKMYFFQKTCQIDNTCSFKGPFI